MWIIGKDNHPVIKTRTNSKTEHWLSCKQCTAKWEKPGKVELKSVDWLRALSLPQLGSLTSFPFTQTTTITDT